MEQKRLLFVLTFHFLLNHCKSTESSSLYDDVFILSCLESPALLLTMPYKYDQFNFLLCICMSCNPYPIIFGWFCHWFRLFRSKINSSFCFIVSAVSSVSVLIPEILEVVGNVSKMIKDFCIMSLASQSSVQVILHLNGPCFVDYRPHSFFGILLRAGQKRLASRTEFCIQPFHLVHKLTTISVIPGEFFSVAKETRKDCL
jgi:hypothetical protein